MISNSPLLYIRTPWSLYFSYSFKNSFGNTFQSYKELSYEPAVRRSLSLFQRCERVTTKCQIKCQATSHTFKMVYKTMWNYNRRGKRNNVGGKNQKVAGKHNRALDKLNRALDIKAGRDFLIAGRCALLKPSVENTEANSRTTAAVIFP